MPSEHPQHQAAQQQAQGHATTNTTAAVTHHPPLNSLLHPHLHTILHIAQDHGLPTPHWTATTPDEKRSLSSDKTITPSSTMKTPQASLQVPAGAPQPNTPITPANAVDDLASGLSQMGRNITSSTTGLTPSSPLALSSSPDFAYWSMSTSPTAEKSQPDWPSSQGTGPKNTTPQSPASILAQNNRRETMLEGQGGHGGNASTNTVTRPKTENELWIEVADALTVTADALKEEYMRDPLGDTSLVIHLLTLFSLSITYEHAPRPQSQESAAAPALGLSSLPKPAASHSRSKSADSTASSSSSPVSTDHIDGITLAQIQCLRTLANLCIDNDDNRSHLLQHDTPLFILTLVKKLLAQARTVGGVFGTNTLTLLKTCMGALLNLQLDHAEARAWLLRLPKPRRNHHPHEEGGHRHPHHHPHRPLSHHLPHHEHVVGSPAHSHHHHSGASHASLHAQAAAAAESRFVVNSPFELEESDTLRILLAVATDPRIYTPFVALRSILGPRVGEFEAEDYLEDEGEGEDRDEWSPPHDRWADVELGAQVTVWAARIMDDLLTFETDEVRASQDDDEGEAQTEASLLPSLSRSALAADPNTWACLLRTLLAFVPTRNKFYADPASPPARQGERRAFSTPRATFPEDASPLLDADLTLVSLCGELLEGCSHVSKGKDANARRFKRAGVEHLPDLLDFIEAGSSPLGTNTSPPASRLERFELESEDVSSLAKEVGRAKANAVKAVVAIASEDANMAALFGHDRDVQQPSFLSRMKTWLQADHRKREDIVSCALLSIANLARSDANCLSLVYEHGIVPHLVGIMHAITWESPRHEEGDAGAINGSNGSSPSSTGRGSGSMLLAHATLGLLKNLSIPVKNKSLIGRSGILSRLVPFLARAKDQAQPIQFGAVGIAKHLSFAPASATKAVAGEEDLAADLIDNAVEICGLPRSGEPEEGDALDECVLASLLELIERTEDTPTRLEATRVLVNLIRTLWSARAQQLTSRGSVRLARRRLASGRVVVALCEMLKRSGKFAVLLNEALLGLTLLASGDAEDSQATSMIALALLGRGGDAEAVTSPGAREATSSPDSIADGTNGMNGNGNGLLSPTGSTPEVRFPPSRSSTTDSSSTNYSSATVTASPETAADVLYDLLTSASVSINASSAVASSTPTSSASTAQAIHSGSSIKTFVPVQVAENGCALLRSLSASRDNVNKELCIRMLPALRGLKVRIGVVYGGRSGVVTTLSDEERQAAAASQRAVSAALEACERASH